MDLQIFNNEEFGKIRTVEKNDVVYFAGSDVAKALGYAIPHKAVQTHCKGVLKWNIPTDSGNQTVETQTMVALTILNRINSDIFPNTVREVVYQDEQFAVTKWDNFENYGWTESVTAAVKNALADNEYPDDMYYFRTLHYHTFGTPYMQSEDLYFSTACK